MPGQAASGVRCAGFLSKAGGAHGSVSARCRALAIHIVRGVVALEPPSEGREGVRLALRGDPLGVRGVEREFEEHAVGVFDIERAAIAVLQHKGVGRRIARRLEALRDRLLCRVIDLERDVRWRCGSHMGAWRAS